MKKNEERVVTPEDLSNETFTDIVKVVVDGRGGVMFIGSISADDFIEWQEAKGANPEAKKNASAQLIARSLVKGPDKNADGTELTEEQRKAASVRIGTPAHAAAFRKAKVSSTERLLKAILKLNYVNQKDEDDAKNG